MVTLYVYCLVMIMDENLPCLLFIRVVCTCACSLKSLHEQISTQVNTEENRKAEVDFRDWLHDYVIVDLNPWI